MAELTQRHREMLAFEAQWWKHTVAKDIATWHLFGLSPTRYRQVLAVIIEWPEAVAHDPLLVRRLRRERSLRSAGAAAAPTA